MNPVLFLKAFRAELDSRPWVRPFLFSLVLALYVASKATANLYPSVSAVLDEVLKAMAPLAYLSAGAPSDSATPRPALVNAVAAQVTPSPLVPISSDTAEPGTPTKPDAQVKVKI